MMSCLIWIYNVCNFQLFSFLVLKGLIRTLMVIYIQLHETKRLHLDHMWPIGEFQMRDLKYMQRTRLAKLLSYVLARWWDLPNLLNGSAGV